LKPIGATMALLIVLISINLFAEDPNLSSLFLSENKDLFIQMPELKKRQDSCIKFIKEETYIGDFPSCMLRGTGDEQLAPLTNEEIQKLSEK
jgi:hypothetical protein